MTEIFTCLTGNSLPYADWLHANLIKTASDPEKIRFKAIADDAFVGESTKWEIVERYPKKFKESGYNAANHSYMLNRIKRHVSDDCSIVIVADVDVAILVNGWDYLIRNALNTELGLITPKFSGASSVYFSAFRASIFDMLDFRSGTSANRKVTTVHLDTGHRVGKQINAAYYKYKDDGGSLRYNFYWKKRLILSHMGGSSKKDFNDDEPKKWRDEVEAWNNLDTKE